MKKGEKAQCSVGTGGFLRCVSVTDGFRIDELKLPGSPPSQPVRDGEVLVIGVDGGGTSTRAILVDGRGKVLAMAEGGPSNYQVVGKEWTAEILQGGIRKLCQAAGVPLTAITRVVLGLAGAGRPRDQEAILSLLEPLHLEGRAWATSDGVIALVGGTGGRPGIVAISGTGSLVMGINDKGEIHRAGGWGPVIGDEGSGYDIGRQALQVAAQYQDGRGRWTLLSGFIQNHWKLAEFNSVLERLSTPMARTEIAALTGLVVESADLGDYSARKILRQAAQELARAIRAVGRRSGFINYFGKRIPPPSEPGPPEIAPPEGWEPVDVIMSGGVFSVAEKYLRPEMQRRLPWARVIRPKYKPVVGAVLLAWQIPGFKAPPLEETELGRV